MHSISLKNISELPFAAKTILDFAESALTPSGSTPGPIPTNDGVRRIFCFYGELGAGKTTLIKELCRQLGVKDAGSSPTFSLVNEYHYPSSKKGGSTIYHFDLYRLKSEAEIYDIGYEEYIFSNNYCFIEWPEKIERLLPENIFKIRIEVKDSGRIITLEY